MLHYAAGKSKLTLCAFKLYLNYTLHIHAVINMMTFCCRYVLCWLRAVVYVVTIQPVYTTNKQETDSKTRPTNIHLSQVRIVSLKT